MKTNRLLSVLTTFAVITGGVLAWAAATLDRAAEAQTAAPPAQAEFNQEQALAQLRAHIKGKENEPAEKVFQNIQTLKGMPAGRLLRVMEMG